jgi:hypothetical protein
MIFPPFTLTRTVRKVKEIMSVAKIEEAEIKPVVQEIWFGDLSSGNSTVLMEVPDELLESISSGGEWGSNQSTFFVEILLVL